MDNKDEEKEKNENVSAKTENCKTPHTSSKNIKMSAE